MGVVMVLEDLFCRPSTLARFRLAPLGPVMDGFCEWLRRRDFSRHAIRRRLQEASHFNRFLRRRAIKDCQDVETSHAERFINEHLPQCRCGEPYGRRHVGASKSVRYLMGYLSERGLVVVPSPPSSPYQELLQEYLDYLKGNRYLAETTIKQHRRYLIPFLEELGAAPVELLRKLSPEQVLALFTKYAQDRGTSLRRCLQGALRLFLRFCFHQGYLQHDLAEAVPSIRSYKLSDVPRGISEEDARKTLQCIDRTTPVGRRDFAIIQLLHNYGLRGGHVRAVRLDDIHWRDNRIRFRAHKGGKEVIEPLIEEVGESLLEYLRHGRPLAPYPEVFLTTRQPFKPLRNPSTVSMMVSQRLQQAGVTKPKGGSHVFRHGFATRMLQQGQSIKTIADLLGHRNINTTFIYTKVDLVTLRQLPLHWPEV